MAGTQLEVTFEAVLTALDGDVERIPTRQEFLGVFDRMADKLYDIDGLVDPGLWGQASNGKIEILLNFVDPGEAEALAACAMAVVREVSAAAGIDMDDCHDAAEPAGEAAAAKRARQQAFDHPGKCPRFVLADTRHAAALVPV